MAAGETEIGGYLEADDTRSTLAAVQGLGAEVEESSGENGLSLRVRGVGLRGPGEAEIDVGNAGTLLRMLPGWLAGQGRGVWTLDGDESISHRPVDRVVEPLVRMGAKVSAEGGLPPLRVEGSELTGIEYELPVASAQVKSCVLLAGLVAEGETTVVEPLATRDHTERMLAAAGARVKVEAGRITVTPTGQLEPHRIEVPADFSSAAFLIAAATLVPGCEVRLDGVGVNPTRTGFLRILERMGGEVETVGRSELGREPVADLIAHHAQLTGTRVGADEVPLAIDELPLVALLGCFAEGETVVDGAEELRHKESDRIEALAEAMSALGAQLQARPDGFAVQGTGGLRGGVMDAAGDHRLALLGAVAGLASKGGVEVNGFEAAAVSYPGFGSDLSELARS
jgi:3-phosphoshikimate 1-carboxyvinyltransferase